MRRSYLYNPKLKVLANKMRREMTVAERKLWFDYLKQTEHRWLRQKPIGNYIVDFYCPKLSLAIEIDGTTHMEDKDVLYDQKRSKELKRLGITVIRFWNDDVFLGLTEVASIIKKEIEKIRLNPPNPPPRLAESETGL